MCSDIQSAMGSSIAIDSVECRKDEAIRRMHERELKISQDFNAKTMQYQNMKMVSPNTSEKMFTHNMGGKNFSNLQINIDTEDVINTVKSGVNPQLENIRDYVNKIPSIIDMLPSACNCAATASAVDGMMHFHSKVSQHVEKLATTGNVMTEIAQTHEDLDKKLAQMRYH